MNKIELLAPAGNIDMLKAAVDCGADAVYCGFSVYNARMNAGNLSPEELQEGCLYAHRRSSRVYLTLNTLISDDELDSALEAARDAYNLGIDGILVQDIGLAQLIHDNYPEIPLHASTQMNIYSNDDYKMLKKMGFTRVVVPRELSVNEISRRVRMAAREGLQIEVFAHGAVCVCTSGLCLFSSMNKSGTRSGNRGLCAQPCRQEYSLISSSGNYEYRKGHLLSPRDRSVIPYISELIGSGIASLKIEGRMRDINYVSTAVTAYRELIDAYYEGALNNELESRITDSLLVSFNRGGSFTSQSLGNAGHDNFLSGEYVGKYGLRIGFISGTDKKKGTISIKLKNQTITPARGDYLSIRQKHEEICSFPIGKIHEAPGSLTIKGLHPDMIAKLDLNSSVFLMNHDFLTKGSEKRKTHIDVSVDTSDKGIIKMNARVNSGIYENVFSETEESLDKFEGHSVPLERIEAQIRKTGNTPFTVDNVYFVSTDEPCCQISLINDIRRCLLENLSAEIDYASSHSVLGGIDMFDMFGDEDIDDKNSSVDEDFSQGYIKTMHIFPTVSGIKGDLYRGADIYAFSVYDFMIRRNRQRIGDFMTGNDAKLAVFLPDYMHDEARRKFDDILRKIKSDFGKSFIAVIDSDLLSDNDFYRELRVSHYLSAGANVYNSRTLKKALELNDASYISYEVPADKVADMVRGVGRGSVLLFHCAGPVRWMQSDFCAVGGGKDKCRTCFEENKFILRQKDGGEESFIIPHAFDCSSYIYGACKQHCDEDELAELAAYGINVIQVYTEEL